MGPVEMDEFGDRQMDFAVWDTINIESGEFQVVCVYNSSMKQLIMQGGRSFQWPDGSPPPDVPECGFKNDQPACLARTNTHTHTHSLSTSMELRRRNKQLDPFLTGGSDQQIVVL
ncbi:atrial natriuretic peptide receptor 1-like isoform X1 [Anarrhichthys ocellatus]|uniref:atrial natriuretic peptide receptor 1-like isoform X1 n=1 Tax=Anarrhichthys ocellatus TaxID=433405 RepID=UPI0012ED9AB7|nr:atrial natriuretic peptide receptor 1-like isoform X1 [Anarrhichthys ocellatus]